MEPLYEYEIECPYCGEVFSTAFEVEYGNNAFIEDCQVCCHPIQLHIFKDDDDSVSIGVGRS